MPPFAIRTLMLVGDSILVGNGAAITGGSGNWTALAPVQIAIISGAVLPGDALTVQITKTGAGVIVPQGSFQAF